MTSNSGPWDRVGGLLDRLRRHRARLMVSAVGLVVAAVAMPKMAPLWASQSVTATNAQQLLVARPDQNLLSGLAMTGGYLREAIETAEQEQVVVRNEQEAFEQFAREVESMSTRAAQPSTRGAVPADVATNTAGLTSVRDRYRETVMDVADYEEAYGESLAEHLTAEFGPDIASVVTGGGPLTMPVKQVLVQQAGNAATQREQLSDRIESECESLHELQPRLQAVDAVIERTDVQQLRHQPFEHLIEREHELREQRHTCEQLLASRQREIHRVGSTVGDEQVFLQEYLYRAMDVTFPVLASVLDRIDQLGDRRRAVTRAISRRY